MKTYPHDVAQSCAFADLDRKAALAVDPSRGLPWFAEFNLLQLQRVGELGLPDCYAQAEDFLYDFWPDLPWNGPEQRAVVCLMRHDLRWPAIVAAVRASVGLDLDAETLKALADNDD